MPFKFCSNADVMAMYALFAMFHVALIAAHAWIAIVVKKHFYK
jgi:hypothetical protein